MLGLVPTRSQLLSKTATRNKNILYMASKIYDQITATVKESDNFTTQKAVFT